jgi:hypothetical protein
MRKRTHILAPLPIPPPENRGRGAIALCALLLLSGCAGANNRQNNRPKPPETEADRQANLPGAITGSGWHIQWRERNPKRPEKPLRVLEAVAQTGELADQDDTNTMRLREVRARLYRNGQAAADIQAPQLTANQRDRILVGTGGVTLTSLADPPDTVVTADKITWDTHTGKIAGVGNAHVLQRLPDGTINEHQGYRVTYNNAEKTFDVE